MYMLYINDQSSLHMNKMPCTGIEIMNVTRFYVNICIHFYENMLAMHIPFFGFIFRF